MLHPEVGKVDLALLSSPQPPIESVLTLLLNALVILPTETVLVLDDYHLIEAQLIHNALTFLLDHLPPRLHLVIASRLDPPLPLARLRARDSLTELRATELRFTPEEAAAFLTEVMGLPLSREEIAALEARTEGWIAGLHLAALSLQDRDDPLASSQPSLAATATWSTTWSKKSSRGSRNTCSTSWSKPACWAS